ncbi:helix-turn-helix transcriptional regulator [Reyranella sp.]|uniref:helix-turn-helix domain-containing protein n=1 Tax=Reyranella sp. TaxID=1929291 RepID=UPI0025D71AAB|nr:helix-turn-helix transcriptional regulator [Reyranella sp.]
MMRTLSASSSAADGTARTASQPDIFGPMLRAWRRRRGASQLSLALQSGVSQRHVSFLESGRARPSREMVVQLSTALDVPLRQRNAMLLAAGFAPAYRESNLTAPELAPVRQAIDRMLKQQEPYPAVVIDRLWNLLDANEAANAFTVFLSEGPPPPPPPGKQPNLLRNLLDPKGLRPKLANWEEVARYLVSTTYAEILADGGEPKALAFIEEVMAYPDVPASFRKLRFEDRPPPVLTLDFIVGGKSLSVFTTIATLGTPQDVTLQEVRIECFFPADDRSDALFRSLAAKR